MDLLKIMVLLFWEFQIKRRLCASQRELKKLNSLPQMEDKKYIKIYKRWNSSISMLFLHMQSTAKLDSPKSRKWLPLGNRGVRVARWSDWGLGLEDTQYYFNTATKLCASVTSEIRKTSHKNTFCSKNVFLLFLLLFVTGFSSSWPNQLSKQRSSWN